MCMRIAVKHWINSASIYARWCDIWQIVIHLLSAIPFFRLLPGQDSICLIESVLLKSFLKFPTDWLTDWLWMCRLMSRPAVCCGCSCWAMQGLVAVNWVTASTGTDWHITWTQCSSVLLRCCVSTSRLLISLRDSWCWPRRLSARHTMDRMLLTAGTTWYVRSHSSRWIHFLSTYLFVRDLNSVNNHSIILFLLS